MDLSEKISTKLKLYCKENNIEITDGNFREILKQAVSKEAFEACFLSDSIAQKIDALAVYGDKLVAEGREEEAIQVFQQGLDTVPNPKRDYEATLWFIVAIADTYWLMNDFKASLKYWNESLEIFSGRDNPFVRFRRGQVLFELGEFEKAKREFTIYSNLDNGDLFTDEDEKYLSFFEQSKFQ